MKFSWLVSGVIACLMLQAETRAAELKVMSFNIRYGAANDGDNSWPHRREMVASTIQSYGPDLLGTQETLPFQAEFLREHLPDYKYVGWSRDDKPDGEQCGIFYRTERFRELESGQFWLSETPETRNSVSWDSSLPRVATWVLLEDSQSDKTPLLFVNTHFDHRGKEARRQSAKLLREWIEARPEQQRVVLTGDFNTGENTAPWVTLAESSRLVDTYQACPPKEEPGGPGTFHGFRGNAGPARIDWILCSPTLTVNESTIDRTNEQGRYPSDHFPVTARLTSSAKGK